MKTYPKAQSEKAESGNLPIVSAFPLSAFRFSEVPKLVLILSVRIYRVTISPAQAFLFGNFAGCRFTPTCSGYALDALHEHGAAHGSFLAAKRICRCHPWGGCGHDPVPKSENTPAAGRPI